MVTAASPRNRIRFKSRKSAAGRLRQASKISLAGGICGSLIRAGGGWEKATALIMVIAADANATCSNEESLQPHPDFKDFWPELAGHKQPATRGIVGNAIRSEEHTSELQSPY